MITLILSKIKNRQRFFEFYRENIGWLGAVLVNLYGFLARLGLPTKNLPIPVSSPQSKRTLLARYGSSDIDNYIQIFKSNAFGPIENIQNVRVILDCGSYVGYSVNYFAEKYPKARIIAVEPAPDNYRMLLKNTRAYQERVHIIHAAVWHEEGQVQMDLDADQGKEWSHRAVEKKENTAQATSAITITQILKQFQIDQVDILKLDVEGAEEKIFLSPDSSWMDKTKNFAIEIHGPHCQAAFERYMTNYRFQKTAWDDLIFCKDIVSVASK